MISVHFLICDRLLFIVYCQSEFKRESYKRMDAFSVCSMMLSLELFLVGSRHPRDISCIKVAMGRLMIKLNTLNLAQRISMGGETNR